MTKPHGDELGKLNVLESHTSNNEGQAELQKEVRKLVNEHRNDPEFWKAMKGNLDAAHKSGQLPDIDIEVDKKGNLIGIEIQNEKTSQVLAKDVVGNEAQFNKQHGQFETWQKHHNEKAQQEQVAHTKEWEKEQREKEQAQRKVNDPAGAHVRDYKNVGGNS